MKDHVTGKELEQTWTFREGQFGFTEIVRTTADYTGPRFPTPEAASQAARQTQRRKPRRKSSYR